MALVLVLAVHQVGAALSSIHQTVTPGAITQATTEPLRSFMSLQVSWLGSHCVGIMIEIQECLNA